MRTGDRNDRAGQPGKAQVRRFRSAGGRCSGDEGGRTEGSPGSDRLKPLPRSVRRYVRRRAPRGWGCCIRFERAVDSSRPSRPEERGRPDPTRRTSRPPRREGWRSGRLSRQTNHVTIRRSLSSNGRCRCERSFTSTAHVLHSVSPTRGGSRVRPSDESLAPVERSRRAPPQVRPLLRRRGSSCYLHGSHPPCAATLHRTGYRSDRAP